MTVSVKQGASVASVIAALVLLYSFLPTFGLNVPPLPTGFEGALGTVVGFFVGLFTKTPGTVTTTTENANSQERKTP